MVKKIDVLKRIYLILLRSFLILNKLKKKKRRGKYFQERRYLQNLDSTKLHSDF